MTIHTTAVRQAKPRGQSQRKYTEYTHDGKAWISRAQVCAQKYQCTLYIGKVHIVDVVLLG